jgi:hypothetical protein
MFLRRAGTKFEESYQQPVYIKAMNVRKCVNSFGDIRQGNVQGVEDK